MLIVEVGRFYLTKYQISTQLNFFSGSLFLQDSVFNGIIPCQIIQNFSIMSPLSYGFFKTFTSDRYHRDMKALKILASNSKHFRIYGIVKKWQIGVPQLTF